MSGETLPVVGIEPCVMSDSHGPVSPVTTTVHDNSWSANLETEVHATSVDLVTRQARRAVEHTAPGYHVNLVTHATHGHPEGYLYDDLRDLDTGLAIEYVEQCGCGGHVTRVHVE